MIRLDQLLKLRGIADTGGQATVLVQSGRLQVNGAVETRRGRKRVLGDTVLAEGQSIVIDEALLARTESNE